MKIRKAWEKHDNVKCDCGYYPKDHYGRQGFCSKCGCTWYWPNTKYQLRKQKEEKDVLHKNSK